MSDLEIASSGKIAGQPTPDQIEQWWAAHTMHPVHNSGIEYVRECHNCEAGDALRRLGFEPYGDGVVILVGLNQDHRRLITELATLRAELEAAHKDAEPDDKDPAS